MGRTPLGRKPIGQETEERRRDGRIKAGGKVAFQVREWREWR